MNLFKEVDSKISVGELGFKDNVVVMERFCRNYKWEYMYLKDKMNMKELKEVSSKWFRYYNGERPHQSLGYRPPMRCIMLVNCSVNENWVSCGPNIGYTLRIYREEGTYHEKFFHDKCLSVFLEHSKNKVGVLKRVLLPAPYLLRMNTVFWRYFINSFFFLDDFKGHSGVKISRNISSSWFISCNEFYYWSKKRGTLQFFRTASTKY